MASLEITSGQIRAKDIFPGNYSLADMILGIPTLTPNQNLHYAQINAAHAAQKLRRKLETHHEDPSDTFLASSDGWTNSQITPLVRELRNVKGIQGQMIEYKIISECRKIGGNDPRSDAVYNGVPRSVFHLTHCRPFRNKTGTFIFTPAIAYFELPDGSSIWSFGYHASPLSG